VPDSDGYPTDEEIACIEAWPYDDIAGLFAFVESCWWMPDFGVSHDLSPAEREVVHAEDGDRYLRLATGGWSGNESIIGAMRRNVIVWSLTWRLTSCGGLHIFKHRRP
jgi:hypothetical protein